MTVRLSEITAELESGARPKGGATTKSGEVPSLGGEHLDPTGYLRLTSLKMIPQAFFNSMRGGKIRQGDILIVKDGATTGKVAFVDHNFPYQDAAINEHVFRLAVEPRIADRRYVFHYLFSPDGQKQIMSDFRGSTIGGIGRTFVDKVEIPLPPLGEQRRIAAILDQAETLRRKRKLGIARAAKLQNTMLHAVMNAGIESCRTVSLNELIRSNDTINYGVVQPGGDHPGGVPLVRVANIVERDLGYQSLKHIDPAIEKGYGRSRLRGDEILIACVGSIGAIALAAPEMAGFNIARAVARIPFDPEKIYRDFLAQYLRSDVCQQYFIAETRTVAQPTLNIRQLAETPVPVIDHALQERFSENCKLADATFRSAMQSLDQLDALFASLQHLAFAGELTRSGERLLETA